jgi:hypothetical protein
MIALDRFFETYDRLAPPWLTDVLVTAVLIVPLVLLLA